MDDKEFRKRLSEVAEWKIPKTEQETSIAARKKRGRKSNEEQYMELREEIFQQEFSGINPTIAPMLVKLKHQPTVCEDCGCECPNGRQKEKKLYETGAKKIRTWREKCLTCSKSKNPYTGKFDLTPQQAPYVWTDFLKERKGMYKTAGNAARKELLKQTAHTSVIENEHETITFYHEKKPST